MNKKSIYLAAVSCATSSYLKKTDEEFREADPVMWKHSPRFMNQNDIFTHKNVLFSAAHHQKGYPDIRETLHLDDDVFIFIDSGGFQLATGALSEKNWNNEKALAYSEKNGNVFPILDRPVTNSTSASDVARSLDLSSVAAKYYLDNRTKEECSILNVLSARSVPDMEHWYSHMKDFEFEGWAHGGTGGNLKCALKGILFLLAQGEFEKEKVKFHHVFGISGMSAMVYFAVVQQELNRAGVDLQLTFDSSYFQRQLGFGGIFMNPKWDGMGLLNFSNKNDYSHLSKGTKLPCLCPICRTVPSTKEWIDTPRNFYMKGLVHNLYLMDAIKHQAETIFELDIEEQQRVTFGTKIHNNILLVRKAFQNPARGMEYIDRMTITDLDSTPTSLEEFFG